MPDVSSLDRVRGSLVGGAVGDALGAGIEFLSLSEIRARFGKQGVTDFVPSYGRRGAITDDTQMTMFTAEGLLRAWVRTGERGICSVEGTIHHAYLRWLLTQGERPSAPDARIEADGWLHGVAGLHRRRAPGMTCLSALVQTKGFASPSTAQNDSKGCGGVMRVAPVGLFSAKMNGDDDVFNTASAAAALTHGHPTGYLSAGYLAVVIATLMRGRSLELALDNAGAQLLERADNEETAEAVKRARELAAKGRPSPEKLETLGAGWIAEEALAISVYCALVAKTFSDGVLLAVNHSGDSDSTGAITGNILGARDGIAAVPAHWQDELELRDEIERLAADLDAIASGRMSSKQAWDAYPGW